MHKYLQEVERSLKPLGTKKRALHDRHYYRSQFANLGITIPTQRKRLKKGYSFSNLEHNKQSKIWDFIFKHASSHEAMNQVLLYFDALRDELGAKDWQLLKSWTSRIDNWVHADYLCAIYSRLYERNPKLIYPQLVKWNASKNSWERRISIVSLIYYASPHRKAPSSSKVLPLVQNLILDKDSYVQKAVGWTLRECYKLYPEKTYTFLKKHIQDLAAVSFSYATEKITKRQKQELKSLRKG